MKGDTGLCTHTHTHTHTLQAAPPAEEPRPQDGSPKVLSYDPAKGVDEEFEGEETEL